MATRRGGPVKKPGKPRRRNQDNMVIPRPMQLPNIGMTHDVRMRFVATGTAGLFITANNLLDTIIAATSATTAYQVFDEVRVNSIELWSYSPTLVVTVNVAFGGVAGSSAGDAKRHTATSIGIEPAYLKARPGKKCLASMFQPNSTNTLFEIGCPTATVVDLHLTYRNGFEGLAPVVVTQALSSGTTGQLYYRGFDAQPIASTKFAPVGTAQVI